MATRLEQTLTNIAIRKANEYFKNNIELYPTRSEIAIVLPNLLAENGELAAFARKVINNMPSNGFCVPDLVTGTIVDLCDAEVSETLQKAVARLFPGSVIMDDVISGCQSNDSIVIGCGCDFSVACNAASGLSGTLYFTASGAIGDSCVCINSI